MSGGLEVAEVGRLLRTAYPASTAETYLRGWADWASWAQRNGACPLPADPADVAAYISSLRADGRTAGTAKVRRASIRAAHRAVGLADPGRAPQVAREVSRVQQAAGQVDRVAWAGAVSRPAAVAPAAAQQAAALAAGEGTPAAARDAAIIELLSGGWLRPGELVRLDWDDLAAPPGEGAAVVKIRSADGAEASLELPPAAQRRLRDWRRGAGKPAAGPMFTRLGAAGSARLSPRDVRRIVARRLEAVGLAGATPSGLRSGAAVAAFQRGCSLPDVLRKGRWKDARQPAAYASDAQAGTEQQSGEHAPTERTAAETAAAPAAREATDAYRAAEADALAALDRLREAREALQREVGPQQAADIARLPPTSCDTANSIGGCDQSA